MDSIISLVHITHGTLMGLALVFGVWGLIQMFPSRDPSRIKRYPEILYAVIMVIQVALGILLGKLMYMQNDVPFSGNVNTLWTHTNVGMLALIFGLLAHMLNRRSKVLRIAAWISLLLSMLTLICLIYI